MDRQLGDVERRLFASLDVENRGAVAVDALLDALKRAGLDPARDGRLEACRQRVAGGGSLSREAFVDVIAPSIVLIKRALSGELVIPDFEAFSRDLRVIFDETAKNEAGANASYIPPLAQVKSDQFGVSICSTDGQRLDLGDTGIEFSIQSATKPITYCFAVEEYGLSAVHRHVGYEPSGRSFNEYVLKGNKVPHNPCINAGAIMCAGMLGRKLAARAERLEHIRQGWSAMTGGVKPSYNEAMYRGESATGHRNRALAYMMHNEDAFGGGVYGEIDDAQLEDIVETYFMCCSLELSATHLATVAATLASGGICPSTGQRVLASSTVKACLSLMYSCGMYDYSGEFAFKIGLPSKSGVGGGLLIVVPGVMGICTWSPRLDAIGNSVRGVEFCTRLADEFAVHGYDNLGGANDKIDPRVRRGRAQADRVEQFIWAASKGDLHAVRRLKVQEFDPAEADYDGRTPLHLAAAEGHVEVVEQLLSFGVPPNPRDRWGGTPLDDATRHGHEPVAAVLRQRGGEPGTQSETPVAVDDSTVSVADHSVSLIYAAFCGDIVALQQAVAAGLVLDVADYDRRTPMHLAAAGGHLDAIRYLAAHGASLTPRDRWGGTPLVDAVRHRHDAVAAWLREHGG